MGRGDVSAAQPAVVTQVSPLLVRLDGAATATAALRVSSYAATLNDRVAVVPYGPTLLVLGKPV
jgi:hypothetical protein